MEIGDKIYCHTRCIMPDKKVVTTIGKVYIIRYIEQDGTFMIFNDFGDSHFFYIMKKNGKSYLDYFYTLKDMRKIKIGKINESNL